MRLIGAPWTVTNSQFTDCNVMLPDGPLYKQTYPPPFCPQGPRTKDLSPMVMDILCNAPTSVLIWPPDEGNTALGQVIDAL